MANNFKTLRNMLLYNGLMAEVAPDMSSITLQLNGVDVEFQFTAGGDVLMDVDVHVYEDKHVDVDPEEAVE